MVPWAGLVKGVPVVCGLLVDDDGTELRMLFGIYFFPLITFFEGSVCVVSLSLERGGCCCVCTEGVTHDLNRELVPFMDEFYTLRSETKDHETVMYISS